MAQKGLNDYFENFLKKEPIFINKKALQSNYTPKNVPYRQKQINQIAKIIAPALRLEKPSNLFIYGKTGTGKTLCVNYTLSQIEKLAEEKKIPLKTLYINCKLKQVADTQYRVMAELVRLFGKKVPPTGLPTDEIYKSFIKLIDEKKQLIILILDEIDQLIYKAGDEILYNLTRLNVELKQSEISLIGISNSGIFIDHIDPRVKSSLSEEELIFPPYNAIQLQKILNQRACLAFNQGIIEFGVIEKCAAYAAREHGDARRALELLRVAGEIAERKNKPKISIKHIDEAEEKIERDRIIDIVSTLPKQHQVTIYTILSLNLESKQMFTGSIYTLYQELCKKLNTPPLTQRRISDIIGELDMLGVVSARVMSQGRYGRTKEIKLAIPQDIIYKLIKILKDILLI